MRQAHAHVDLHVPRVSRWAASRQTVVLKGSNITKRRVACRHFRTSFPRPGLSFILPANCESGINCRPAGECESSGRRTSAKRSRGLIALGFRGRTSFVAHRFSSPHRHPTHLRLTAPSPAPCIPGANRRSPRQHAAYQTHTITRSLRLPACCAPAHLRKLHGRVPRPKARTRLLPTAAVPYLRAAHRTATPTTPRSHSTWPSTSTGRR